MALVGSNCLRDKLRLLTAIELYLNADYYASHPYLNSVFDDGQFSHLNTIFNLSLSMKESNYPCFGSPLSDYIKQEALFVCTNFNWCGLMPIFSCSSVIEKSVTVHYADGVDFKMKTLFGRKINPRPPVLGVPLAHVDLIYLMYSVDVLKSFQPNHFVPCVFLGKKDKIIKKENKKINFVKPIFKSKVKKNPSFKQIKDSSREALKLFAFSPTNNNSKEFPSLNSTKTELNIASNVSSVSVSPVSNPISSKLNSFDTFSATCSSVTDTNVMDVETSLPSPIFSQNVWDVALYREKVKGLDNRGIYELIQNVFKPDSSFEFPKRGRREFKLDWLNKFSWLCYSPSLDGAFCLPCVLFADKTRTRTSDILFSKPHTHWNSAVAKFKSHEGAVSQGMHKVTSSLYVNLLNTISGKAVPVDIMINQQRSHAITENRKKLVPIVDAIIVCGRQGIALRGHRDDSKDHPKPGEYSTGRTGNFLELLNFRVRGGDTVLKEHLTSCGGNAMYTSKTTQNNVLNSISEVITSKIVNKVKKAKFFSILADEAFDSSCQEQMSLCLRYVDEDFHIREDFIRFLHCEHGLSGEGLTKLLLDGISDLGLNIDNVRGQGYDGAGNVAGKEKGVAARILKLNKKALFVHCSSHRLSLSVSKSCGIPLIRNVMDKVKEISYFFNFSEKRQTLLVQSIKTYCPESRKKKLIDVCRTRWLEKLEGLDVFQDLYVPIFHCLHDMALNENKICNNDTSTKALSLSKAISDFEFIVSLVLTRAILAHFKGITEKLQRRDNDFVAGIAHINNLKNTISKCRVEVDTKHQEWFETALHLASAVEVEVKTRRIVKTQTKRTNTPSISVSDFYKKSITIAFLDHLSSELNSRFDFSSVNYYNGLVIVPEKLMSMYYSGQDWRSIFLEFSNFYYDDLPNPVNLDAELNLWESHWLNSNNELPNTIEKTLTSVDLSYFQNLSVLLRIMATIPVTTCECERAVSALRRLKDYKRSTMVAERLNAIALLHIHTDIIIDFQEVIDVFARDPRRLELI